MQILSLKTQINKIKLLKDRSNKNNKLLKDGEKKLIALLKILGNGKYGENTKQD